MDPQLEWERMVRAYAIHDWIRVEKIASGLLYWLEHGGSAPDVVSLVPLGNIRNWAVARYGCQFSLIQARKETGAKATRPSAPTK